MIEFYFIGHNFEYEVRNALRIFDLNINYKIKDISEFNNSSMLKLVTELENKFDELLGKAMLYDGHKLLFAANISSKNIDLEKDNEKKLKKTLVVKAVHAVLKDYYKTNSDYGILTGVRPVKILFTAKKSGKSIEQINHILKNTYEVDFDKINLIWEVSEIEAKYINDKINKNNYNLYIGIPFCPTKCTYCSFASFANYNESLVNKYLDTLIFEIEKTIEMAMDNNLKLNTVYFGGGTPSVLDTEQISLIFHTLKKYYDLSAINEITFEAGRPDTITEEKLKCLKNFNVNRISINPQTMNEKTLNIIGRKHSVEDIIDKYCIARKVGFDSINMDLIIGLPGETLEDVKYTIDEVIKLKPDNITVHSLSYKRNSELSRESKAFTKDYDVLKDMQKITEIKCKDASYIPYYMYRQKNIKGNLENIGYTIKGKESIYNIVIIEEIETILACGVGSTSKVIFENNRHESVHNFKSIKEYRDRINEIIEKKKSLISEARKNNGKGEFN